MPTARGLGLTVAAAIAWVVSRSFGIPELQIVAVAAVALVVLAVLYVRVAAARLRIQRTVRPSRMAVGERATVNLTVTNVGRLPTVPLLLRDRVPGRFVGTIERRLPSLRAGERLALRVEVRAQQRGKARFGPVTVTAEDPFTLARRRHVVEVPGEVAVYPEVVELAAGIPLGGGSGVGPRTGRRLHQRGEDLAMVREYVQGDDLRAVHWPSTAHRGRLMVRQSESSQVPRAVVLLDRRASRHRGHGPAASFEAAVGAAASIVGHLAQRGYAAVLLDEPVAATPAAQPLERHLDRLADLEDGSVDLPGVLEQVASGLAGDGTLFAVVVAPEPDELRALVRAGRGFSTRVAVIIDPASFGDGRGPSAAPSVGPLRAAGWRAVTLRRGDALPVRWGELVAQRRTGAGVAS